jgi:hypothetical protein
VPTKKSITKPLNIYLHHRPTKNKKIKSRYSSYSTSFILSFSSIFDSSSHALAMFQAPNTWVRRPIIDNKKYFVQMVSLKVRFAKGNEDP